MDSISILTNCDIIVKSADGSVKDERHIHNTTTNAGKYGLADQILASPSLGKPTHMAVGTGTPSSTALGTESDRNAFTSKTRNNAVVTIIGDWAAGDATATITEAGLFDAASTGNMWASASFSAITKAAGDTLQITWTLTVA
jgi:hypothetical protein